MTVFLYKKILEAIRGAEHILLITDERIDGDTIGATLGMYHVLRQAGKDVEVYSPKPLDSRLKFLPGTEVIQRDPAIFSETRFDLMMVFDAAEGAFLEPHRMDGKGAPLIVFDHHASNPLYGDVNLVEPSSASAAEVVWHFVKYGKFDVNREAAQCFLTGIVTDTDVFSTSNTNFSALEAAEELTKIGAKLQVIIRETMMNKTLGSLQLWGLAFERLHEHPDFSAIATALTHEDIERLGAEDDDVHKLSNFLNAMLEEHETVLVLFETKNGGVKASLRSRTRDVSSLAAQYGGGGHRLAAGFVIPHAMLYEENGIWRWKSTV
ncbi:MAG: DHH family phosphoesterase [Patescibacteria group bacterium]|jgi:phosphoesterase RecJ-like protein